MNLQVNHSPLRLLYIAVHSHKGWGAEYWLDKAFSRLGLTIIKLDYRQIRSDSNYDELRRQIVSLEDDYDAIFLQRADNIPEYVFAGLSKPIVFWSTELLHRRKDVNQLLRTTHFEWLFVHTPRCIDIIEKKFSHQKDNVSVLHNATPVENIVSDKNKKNYFAIFNRSLSFRRRRWLYPSLDLIDVKQGRYGDDYFNDLKQSYIAVNIHFSKNIDFETGIFEAMSAGCVVVSETLADKTCFDLKLKDAIIQVSSPKELKDVLLELNNNSTLLNEYRDRSLKAIQLNTWDQRAKQIVNVFEKVLSK
tara:strand:- start:5827 stop:6741 length:915 start_codon:yes stop_codon:yes gene_type:complete